MTANTKISARSARAMRACGWKKTNRGYSNRAIDFRNSVLFDDFAEGGLGSLDNHHPSGLGYSVIDAGIAA